MIAAIGAALAVAGLRRESSWATTVLGAASAATLAGADVSHSLRGRVQPTYLLDGAAELVFAAAWARLLWDEVSGR